MNLADLVKELLSYSFENEWFEFKENMKSDYELGEYISALFLLFKIEKRFK